MKRKGLAELIGVRLSQLPDGTDAFRVLDGEGDGCREVFIDKLADRWLISTRDCDIPRFFYQELCDTGDPVYHKKLDRDVKEPPAQICGPEVSSRFVVREQGHAFLMDMESGYSQGLFLDQRDNRRRLASLVKPGDKILNTFSYTGAFSIYAAMAGGITTTLDLAQPCLDWARENMELNRIDPAKHYFCRGDVLHWLTRFARQGKKFEGIVLDPPTFSRDDKGNIWRAEKDFGRLVSLALDCISPGGWILATTNCRKLSEKEFIEQIRPALRSGTRWETCPMPFDFTGEPYLKTVWIYS